MLNAPDAAAGDQVIVTHMARMESQLAATQAVVASLQSLLLGLDLAGGALFPAGVCTAGNSARR